MKHNWTGNILGWCSLAVTLGLVTGAAAPNAAFEWQAVGESAEAAAIGGEVCGGFAGIPCEEGEFCKFGPGRCEILEDQGVCVVIPEVCPDVAAPVCGCDGVTYDNACFADMAGVAIDHDGACAWSGEVCGGILGIPCEDGEFCKFGPGRCDFADDQGVCTETPEVCLLILDPVCGCDGVTYDNPCFADMAGVSIDHPGECGIVLDICGGIAGFPCDDGEFCKFSPGQCDIIDDEGVCVAFPEACPDVFDPVCGCDGVTYGNECFADMAGVSIDHAGACVTGGDICGGILGIPCDEGEFCKFGPGRCDFADDQGVCTETPEICPLILDPVCGCDGVTYDNPCFADMAGVSIDHAGPCDTGGEVCGGFAGIPCDEGEFCKFGAGRCEIADDQGVCMDIPEGCPAIFDPVCGCDGRTYSNECFADIAGVAVDHAGECELVGDICGGIAGFPCDEGEFCKFGPGRCDFRDDLGVCVTFPEFCPAAFDPVCGCDGVTYDNECVADAAGMSIDHRGECDACESAAACPETDVNCDDITDGFDIATVRRSDNWLLPTEDAAEPRADVNGDGVVDGFDIAAIRSSACFLVSGG